MRLGDRTRRTVTVHLLDLSNSRVARDAERKIRMFPTCQLARTWQAI